HRGRRAIRRAPRPPPRTRRLRPQPVRHRKAMASSSVISLVRALARAFAALGAVGCLGVLAPRAALALGHPPDQAAAPAPAAAPAAPDDEIPPPPPTFQAGGVTVDEHLGARVPLDARFRTQDGTP